ncbi:MAG: response regulator transcription factor [Anaerolineae bacterium]|nr:response regulator transcription factor [Anaerolineae bacterium]
MTHHILVVDDEDTLRHFLRLNLQDQGYRVSEAADGQIALRLIEKYQFDVALVDLHLTDMHGLDIMRHLRQVSPKTSVIILTGYATLDSSIEALRQGAHDYLIKPCRTTELLASVADGIARQSVEPPTLHREEAQSVLEIKDLKLNLASRQVSRNGEIINLTPTEFDILATLMANPDTAIDSITLIKQVRGYEATEADARAIARVHVHRLRHKLEVDPANPRYITTVAGGRYLMMTG